MAQRIAIALFVACLGSSAWAAGPESHFGRVRLGMPATGSAQPIVIVAAPSQELAPFTGSVTR